MDERLALLFVLTKSGGVFAPISFILFHVIRQFLFIPVPIVIITGGILFGTIWGTIYSFIGLMIPTLLFYFIIQKLPNTHMKLTKMKDWWFGEYRNLTVPQITVLRLIPFIHYHLMNFCLIERNHRFKAYCKNALITNMPLVLIYTVCGEFIRSFTPTMIVILLFALSILVYVLREKVTIIKWREFFKKVV